MYEIMDPSLNMPRTGADPIQLPLDIMSAIISHLKSPSDLANVARTSRINYFLSAPLLYHTVRLRRPLRRPRLKSKCIALGALMKPGIAACVKVLEIVGEGIGDGEDWELQERLAEEWWQSGQWSDEDTVWAVAVAGVLGGCTRLETFLWKTDGYIHPLLYTALVRNATLKELGISHPILKPTHTTAARVSTPNLSYSSLTLASFSSKPATSLRPPISSIPPFRTLRRLCLSNLPETSYFIDDYSPAIFFSPNLESISLSWRTPTPLSRMSFLQGLLRHRKSTSKGATAMGSSKKGESQVGGMLRLKELELRNAVFDFPVVGDVKEWIDIRQLEKLSLLDCEFVDVASWLELIGAGAGATAEGEQATGSQKNGAGFSVNIDSPTTPTTTGGSTPGTTPSSSSSVLRAVRLNLKSLRVNSCASYWISLLKSFGGLEELYILDPPVETADEAANRLRFLDVIGKHHGSSLKRLRLCSRWNYEKLDIGKLFKSCAGLEELGFSMVQSQWKILEVLIVFLPRLRCVHLLTVHPPSREEVLQDLKCNLDTLDAVLAQDDMLNIQIFAFHNFAYRADQTTFWDKEKKQHLRRGRFVELEEVQEWAGMWRAGRIN